jgi:hypothetical protein
MEVLPVGSGVTPAAVPAGNAAGGTWPTDYADGPAQWEHAWSWRRSYCAANRSLMAVNPGDVSQQNLGNDLDTAYLFPTMSAVKKELASGWHGGLNLTALRMLEDRAYGWYAAVFHRTVLGTLSSVLYYDLVVYMCSSIWPSSAAHYVAAPKG